MIEQRFPTIEGIKAKSLSELKAILKREFKNLTIVLQTKDIIISDMDYFEVDSI